MYLIWRAPYLLPAHSKGMPPAPCICSLLATFLSSVLDSEVCPLICWVDVLSVCMWAGVATAFASPIGGLLFTIEEGASFYSTSIFWRGFLSTGIGVLTLHFLVECAVRHPGHGSH